VFLRAESVPFFLKSFVFRLKRSSPTDSRLESFFDIRETSIKLALSFAGLISPVEIVPPFVLISNSR